MLQVGLGQGWGLGKVWVRVRFICLLFDNRLTLLLKKLSTEIKKKRPLKFTQKNVHENSPKKKNFCGTQSTRIHQKCPREFTYFVHKNSLFMSTTSLLNSTFLGGLAYPERRMSVLKKCFFKKDLNPFCYSTSS